MKNHDDRRKKMRVPLSQTLRHSKYQVLGTPVFQENSSIDLSSNGIAFETAQEYALGTLVLLEVEIDSEPVKLLVCVVRVLPLQSVKSARYQIGAELIAIDPEHKKIMQHHLGKLINGVKIKSLASKKISKNKKSKKVMAKKKPQKVIRKKKIKKKAVRKKP